MFGKSAAVINFHRLVRFFEAAGRRWLCILLSFFYDDATIQDVSAARGRGQRHLRGLFREFGIPLSKKKEVDMCSRNDFLGLEHDVSHVFTKGVLTFAPRSASVEKVQAVMRSMIERDHCSPAECPCARPAS